jgi:Leucine-rich repeat (LRR) protein
MRSKENDPQVFGAGEEWLAQSWQVGTHTGSAQAAVEWLQLLPPSLEALNLSTALIRHAPDLHRFHSLQGLSLGFNRLEALPPRIIAPHTALRTLQLNNNRLATLPQELCTLVHLEHLNLAHNSLESLPANLGELTELTALMINHNPPLAQLPDIGGMLNLVELHAAGCSLTCLNPSFPKLSKCLTHLDLSSNQLQKVEEVGDLTSLVTLQLGRNQLSDLSPSLFSSLIRLVDLDVCHNLLHHLPEGISNLVHLQSLNLENNQLEQLPGIFFTCVASMSRATTWNTCKVRHVVLVFRKQDSKAGRVDLPEFREFQRPGREISWNSGRLPQPSFESRTTTTSPSAEVQNTVSCM